MDIEGEGNERYIKRRMRAYWSAVALMAIVTIAQVAFYRRLDLSTFLYIASCVTIGAGVLTWCTYDSLSRGFLLSSRYRFWIGLLGPIVVPVYFFQSRGASRAAKAAFGLGLYVPFYAVYYGTWYVTVAILTKAGYFGAA